jgi:hypothetical protein
MYWKMGRRTSTIPQKMFGQRLLLLQFDRRGAIIDRIGNVKIHPEVINRAIL